MWLDKLKSGLAKTGSRLSAIRRLIDSTSPENLQAIERLLLEADVGVGTSKRLVETIKAAQGSSLQEMLDVLTAEMVSNLEPYEQTLDIPRYQPFVLLIVGVNGSGKTTTAGKLAGAYRQQGHQVVLAAGDTFRAAAIDQLKVWGERSGVPVVAKEPGADSAAVIYDAYASAKAKSSDLLIADTAGRMHTDTNLMEELKKVQRVISKQDDSAPHEVLLVLDGTTGQAAAEQLRQFHQHIGVTGLAVTKLDGSTKAGMLFALSEEFRIPIRFIGVGEQIDDLQVFKAQEYVDALLQ